MKWLAIAALAACSHPHPAAIAPGASATTAGYDPYAGAVRIEVLLDTRAASGVNMIGLADAFDISPKHQLVVEDAQKMYVVGWGGIAPAEGVTGTLDAFAYTPDGILLGIRGTTLLYLDETGQPQTLFTLPSEGAGMARSAAGVFVFERHRSDGTYGLYEITAGRRVRKLLESPRPIDSVAQVGDRLVFASGGLAFDAKPGAPLTAIARLPSRAITAVAASADKVYVSDGVSTYVLGPQGAALLVKGVGGRLRFDGEGLVVLDSTHRTVVRIVEAR